MATELMAFAQDLATYLAPALPYLAKMGDGAAIEAGKRLLGAAGDKTAALWARLSPAVEAKPAAAEAVRDVAEAPGEAMAVSTLAWQLRKLLTETPGLADDLAGLLAEAKEAARPAGVHVEARSGGVAMGRDASGNIIITGQGNDARQ